MGTLDLSRALKLHLMTAKKEVSCLFGVLANIVVGLNSCVEGTAFSRETNIVRVDLCQHFSLR